MEDALLLTGAAARISQEVAIIDQLIDQKNLTISEERTMVAGFSSGALNAMAINACFRKEAPLSWDDYYKKEILFQLKTEDVFLRKKLLPYNTKPLRSLIEQFIEKADFNMLSDLPYHTYILAFNIFRFKTIWANNRLNRNGYARLADLLMATSAIPIIFPDATVGKIGKKRCSIARPGYIDGGAGGSFKRFKPHLSKFINRNNTLKNIYIISPMREVSAADYNEFNALLPTPEILKLNLKDFKLLKGFLHMISMNGFDKFIEEFHEWTSARPTPVAENIYVCTPRLKENYPILNFDKQEEQYNAVKNWAIQNPKELAIPITDYIENLKLRS